MRRTSLFASRKESDRIRFTRSLSSEQVHGAGADLSKVRPQIYPEEV
jgi:hypothetical protein